MIVAVDGPAGSGKSSVCAEACRRIGWSYINTGFLYRAIAYICMQREVDFNIEDSLVETAVDFVNCYKWESKEQRLFYKGEDITSFLADREVGNKASYIAKSPSVREHLLPVQRSLGLDTYQGVMMDGRDIGTVVFPDADLKIFMTASLEERASRRKAQLEQMQDTVISYEAIKQDIASRDRQDAARSVAPLKQAEDALVFDTSGIGVEDAINSLIELLRSHKLC